MTSRVKSIILIAVILALVALTSWCSRRNGASYIRLQGTVYNTIYHVTYQGSDDWQDSITILFQEVDASLSMFNPHSVISRFNQNDPYVVADEHFRRVFEHGQQISEVTHGAFDMTVAPLVNLWGFGFKHRNLVTRESIDSVMQFIGYKTVSLDEQGHLHKMYPETILDASSIAKGYAVDVIARFLERHDTPNYMVEIGGEVVVKGLNPKGEAWAVGISKPIEDAVSHQDLQAIVHLNDGGLATSGNYRNFYYKDGHRYAHTINPHTGYPVQQDILSATVYASDCMTADAYATSFMVLGSAQALEILSENPSLKAYFILAGTRDDYETISWPHDWVN